MHRHLITRTFPVDRRIPQDDAGRAAATWWPTAPSTRYGLPPFYELHAWIWKRNPSGTFSDWNPRVSCSPPRH